MHKWIKEKANKPAKGKKNRSEKQNKKQMVRRRTILVALFITSVVLFLCITQFARLAHQEDLATAQHHKLMRQASHVSAQAGAKEREEEGEGEDRTPNSAIKKVPAAAVWTFKHVNSNEYAELKVNGRSIEFVHPLLTQRVRGRERGIHPNQLKIQPLLAALEKEDLLPKKGRMAYLDVGARMFPGSTGWFMRYYPHAKDFHATMFELLDLEETYKPAKAFFANFSYVRKAAWTHDNGVRIKGLRMARVSDNVIVQKGDNRSEWVSPSVDLANYIMQEFTPNDFVVLKMDIEGGEWTVIPHLLATGAMKLVDEVFLECHPMNFDDYKAQPGRLPQVCIDFINDLRSMGVYTHRWF